MSKPGNGHKQALHFHQPPQRVVSLVPSLTESMFDLGFGGALVGITDYCIHPTGAIAALPRLGGTKAPNIEAILDLSPDLVLANQEENQRQSVEALEAYGVPVWVTFPKTVRESLDTLWTLTGIYHSREAAARLQTLEVTLEWAAAAALEKAKIRYFCPIWYQESVQTPLWWMTFNQYTYSHDLLKILGGANVFADRQRRYPLEADLGLAPAEEPGERDTRYPRISFDEIIQAQPQIILLPDEPFEFQAEHEELLHDKLAESPAVKDGRIHRVDGSLITWFGTRLARALQELPALFE
jgi:ABC-type Fe3+-hydroxamate transport system substrate-binding protein